MVQVNDAWAVLGDERLRHAYDHRDEVVALLSDLHDADADPAGDEGTGGAPAFACRRCGAGFSSFDHAADHVDAEHPHTDYAHAIFALQDDSEPASTQAVKRWGCKFCPAQFDDFDDALTHADQAHPERTVIDPRNAVEVR
jgi:hypothetical protein